MDVVRKASGYPVSLPCSPTATAKRLGPGPENDATRPRNDETPDESGVPRWAILGSNQ
jgi:hypothetical protein